MALAGFAALMGAACVAWGVHTGTDWLARLWRVLSPLAALGMLVASACLVWAFLTDDFSVAYVANHSNRALAVIYKFAAFWGSHEGSMLLWTLLIALWSAVLVCVRCDDKDFLDRMQAVMLFVVGLFGLFLLFTSNPFLRNLPLVPAEGRDLNPILQDIGMILHPPVLFMGYAGLALCFAAAVSVLWARRWSRAALSFSTVAAVVTWVFLTAGNALGSWWAYTELGWGGWWFWDPVENASFIPWLGTTALLHALLMARFKGQLQRLCLALMLGCFGLCLLGTFIVRSGVMASVHAFASDPNRGVAIFAVSVILLLPALILYLRAQAQTCAQSAALESSEDMVMTAGIYLTVVAGVAVLIGTIYPLVHDSLGLGRLTVGAPYFNSFFAPMAVMAAVLAGAAHVLRMSGVWPAVGCGAVSLTAAVIVVGLTGPKDWPIAAAGFAGAFWILTTALVNIFAHRLGGRRLSWAALVAHAAVAVAMLGATGASNYESEALVRMEPGAGRPLADVIFVHTDTFKVNTHAYFGDAARIEVLDGKDESLKTILYPMRQTYVSSGMQMSSAGIEHGFWKDYYVSMGNQLSQTEWLVRLSVKPLVSWLWLGAALMMLAGIGILVRGVRRRKTKEAL